MSLVPAAIQYLIFTAKEVNDLEYRARKANGVETEDFIRAELPFDIDLEDIKLADQSQALTTRTRETRMDV